MLLVTYASADGYLDHVQDLLRGWRGEVFMEILPPDWPWTKVCSYKPTLIQHAMRAHNGFIVYVDADGIIKTPFDADMVRAALGGKTFGGRWYHDGGRDWMLSGTILINATHRDTSEWIMEWRRMCETRPDRYLCDQANLSDLAPKWDHASLGPEWCWMEPTSPSKALPPPDPVYIWHMQKSREFAGKKGGHGHD